MTIRPPADDDLLSVADVAERFGVSAARVRSLAGAGRVPAQYVGGRWLFRTSAVATFAPSVPGRGRPMSPRIAWAVLAGLEGRRVPWSLHREERARVGRYLERPRHELAARVRARAVLRRMSVGPRLRERLSEHPSWVDGGCLTDGSGSSVDVIYVSAGSLDALLLDAAALEDPWGSLVVRVVDDRYWPFGDARRGAPAWPGLRPFDAYDAFGSDSLVEG